MNLNLGMCIEEITRPSIQEVLDAVKAYGIKAIQFNLASLYGEEVPPCDVIDGDDLTRVGNLTKERGLEIVALNGTINMIEPDPVLLEEKLRRFEKLANVCHNLGCNLLTLCTGSLNPYSQWFNHPFNYTQEAWDRCKSTAGRMVEIADRHDVYLGIETEVTNVCSSPERSKKFIEEMGSPRFKIIMDISNMVNEGESTREQIEAIIERAFANLSEYVVLAHAKDIKGDAVISLTSAGNGLINFDLFFRKLKEIGYTGPVVMHHLLHESEFEGCVKFLNETLARVEG
jgi:sugar phosphate isomerase/epimerase